MAQWNTLPSSSHQLHDPHLEVPHELEHDKEAELGMNTKPALCPECSELLQIYPVPTHGLFAGCMAGIHGTASECHSCRAAIRRGSLRFVCESCDADFCMSCGPGVVVENHCDSVDHAIGDTVIKSPLEPRALLLKETKTRGLKADTTVARPIVEQAAALMEMIANEQKDCLDSHWGGPEEAEGDLVAWLLTHSPGDDDAAKISSLFATAQTVLESEPTLNEVGVPCKIFGDIHGQLRDLLLHFHDFGFPGKMNGHFVFNGDWVDRGDHQLECILVIFALKVMYPDRVWLNRGNHEDRLQNKHGGEKGFYKSVLNEFAEQPEVADAVFERIHQTFDWLPLGARIDNRVLVVHGGIGAGEWSVEELKAVPRPLTYEQLQDPILWNILWSDPVPETLEESFGQHSSPRDGHAKTIHAFGGDVTEKFCLMNNLDMVVRSHQEEKRGTGYQVMHAGRLMRVFSARDYEGNGNDGAILHVTRSDQASDEHPLIVRPQVLRALTKPSP